MKSKQILVHKKFAAFRSKHLGYNTQKLSSFDELAKVENEYQAFVVGSDMVWNYSRSHNLQIYFLQFTHTAKRIAYSPSFGSNKIPDVFKDEYKNGLSAFSYLSCRENSGISIIRELTEKRAEWTLDPTLVIPKSVWNTFQSHYSNRPKKYILVYLFEGIPEWMKKNIKSISLKLNAQIIEIPTEIKGWCRALHSASSSVGPEEFVDLFRNAACVITNSYHGLMFSLIFSKQFYVIQRKNEQWGQFENRITDILDKIGCQNRLIEVGGNFEESDIDYDKVHIIIDTMREISKNYLKNAISSVFRNEQ